MEIVHSTRIRAARPMKRNMIFSAEDDCRAAKDHAHTRDESRVRFQ
jgi:hypothetical protein